MSENTAPEQESSGTTRRRFLGAAAAAAALTGLTATSTATSNQPDIDIERDETGGKQGIPPKARRAILAPRTVQPERG